MKTTRRSFLVGCSAAVASYAGSSFNTVAFGAPADNQDILIVLFLRGGMDGLSLIPPIDGIDRGHYEAARPGLKIPTAGLGAALPLNAQFGLHPNAAPLRDLFQAQKLSIVHGVGMSTVVNKSHFDAIQFVELGTPGVKSTTSGWLTRHLQSASNLPPAMVMPSLAVGDLQPVSLAGSGETVNMREPASFNIANGPWPWRTQQKAVLRSLYESDTSWLHHGGAQALNAVDIIEGAVTGTYTPSGGAVYPDSPFGEQLKVLAQMIKLDLGLQVATLDFGGWDTHESQGSGSQGYFADMVSDLAAGLSAFYTDLDGSGATAYTNRLTLITQSEFGRELYENNDAGTEHGYGNNMLVLSGNAVGGFHGQWPGLAPDRLVDGTDIAVTTDFRRVVSEVLIRRLGNPDLTSIFPGYTGYAPLGVVQGPDLNPPSIFADGFESGDLRGWSSAG